MPAFKELGKTRRRVHVRVGYFRKTVLTLIRQRLALEMLARRQSEAEVEDRTDLLSIFIREQKVSPESDDASMAQLLDHVSTFVLVSCLTMHNSSNEAENYT